MQNAVVWRTGFSAPASRRRRESTRSMGGDVADAASAQNSCMPAPDFPPKGHRACPVGPSFQGKSGAIAATSASDAKVQVFDPRAEVHVPGQWNHPLVPACRKFRAPAFRPSKLRPAGKALAPCGFLGDGLLGSTKETVRSRPVEKRKSGRVNEDDRSSRSQI